MAVRHALDQTVFLGNPDHLGGGVYAEPIAEHAAAMDWIAWGIVKKKDGVVPSWVLDAMNNDEPAPAPAEPGSDFSLDDEESF